MVLAASALALAVGVGPAAAATTPAPPTASFTSTPAKPLVGEVVAFGSTATAGTSPIAIQAWDLDGDWRWDVMGPAATYTFTTPGLHTVRLAVLASDGRWDIDERAVEVFAPPTASFDFSPAKPGSGRPVTLTSTASAAPGLTLAEQKWDLDADGEYDDATGGSATQTFAGPGSHVVGLQVTDSKGIEATTTRTIVVYSPPTAAFSFSPAAPVPGQQITFTSASSDPDGAIVAQSWDVDGDGFDDGSGPVLQRSFAAGTHTVRLRVTDTQGLVTDVSHAVDVVAAPTAAFAFLPATPGTDAPVSFTSTAAAAHGVTLASQAWDLDGDGAYDDGSGPGATMTFPDPGSHTIGLRVVDSRGIAATTRRSVAVYSPPTAGFDFTPAAPVADDELTFTSSATDPDGQVATEAWDLDGDGNFTDATGPSARRSFAAGRHTVRLRVVDSQGLTATSEHDVVVAARPGPSSAPSEASAAGVPFETTSVTPLPPVSSVLTWISPFPVVRVAGVARRNSTQIKVFSVLTPSSTVARAGCHARGCPRRALLKPAPDDRPLSRIRLRRLERTFPAGTRIQVSVTREGFVGKFTAIVLRRMKAPARTDACLVPGHVRPMRCPGR